jgi:hypothetical protein
MDADFQEKPFKLILNATYYEQRVITYRFLKTFKHNKLIKLKLASLTGYR